MDWQDEESPSPGALSDDCQETWIDGAEVVVLNAARDGHAIEAALLGGGLTEHVAELGAPVLRAPWHLRDERGKGEGGVREETETGGQSRRIIPHSDAEGTFHTAVPVLQAQSREADDGPGDAFFKTGAAEELAGPLSPVETKKSFQEV